MRSIFWTPLKTVSGTLVPHNHLQSDLSQTVGIKLSQVEQLENPTEKLWDEVEAEGFDIESILADEAEATQVVYQSKFVGGDETIKIGAEEHYGRPRAAQTHHSTDRLAPSLAEENPVVYRA